jgi:hypothetical protein
VCGDEVLRIGREVILLAAAQAEFTKRRDKSPQIPLADYQLRGSGAAVED